MRWKAARCFRDVGKRYLRRRDTVLHGRILVTACRVMDISEEREAIMLKGKRWAVLESRQAEWCFYLSLAMLSLFVFLVMGKPGYVLFDDSGSYMDLYLNMEGVMPVYPLFLHVNKLLFGESRYLYVVVVEQAALASVCVIILVGVLKRQFQLKYWEAYVCYILTLLPFTTDLPQAMTTHVILTEGIAYALFYLFSAALMCSIWNKSLMWLSMLYVITLLLSSTRSQLQILFGVCGVAFIYIVLLRKSDSGNKRMLLRLLCALAGCMIIGLTGIWITGRVSSTYQQIRVEARKEQQAAEGKRPALKTSQYVTLIFSRGMYEADQEDYLLFEDEKLRELFLEMYPAVDDSGYRYAYASPGLWMWQDIAGGIGAVGGVCFRVQSDYYQENYPELVYDDSYSAVRSKDQLQIGLTLLGAHFGRFLYHTLIMLPQAFICTVFFQIERIYLFCHLVTLFLYVSAAAMMIWAYKSREVRNAYGEFMCAVLGTNLVMIVVISMVFFGQQRYLVYNFGLFYISYFLLLMQVWKLYGRGLVVKLWKRREK